MAFKGRDPRRSKIEINNKIIEQVNTFNYLGNLVSHDKENRQQNYKIFKDNRIINNTHKTKQSPKRYMNKIT
jgi:hypothetical protein